MRRLEAATLLLENIVAPSHGDASASTNGSLPNQEARLAAVEGTDPPLPTSPQPISEPLLPAIEDFNTMITEDVQTYVNMSEDIGGLVAEQVGLLEVPTLSTCQSSNASLSSLLLYFELSLPNSSFSSSRPRQRSQIFNLQLTWRY